MRKKWYNLLSKSRQQIAAYRREITGTGGGPSTTKLSAIAETVQDILGESNASISGLEEGVDSSLLQIIDMTSSLESDSLFASVQPVQASCSSVIQDIQPVPPSASSHEARKSQLELDVLEAQLLYYNLKIKKIKNVQ